MCIVVGGVPCILCIYYRIQRGIAGKSEAPLVKDSMLYGFQLATVAFTQFECVNTEHSDMY